MFYSKNFKTRKSGYSRYLHGTDDECAWIRSLLILTAASLRQPAVKTAAKSLVLIKSSESDVARISPNRLQKIIQPPGCYTGFF